MTLLEPDVFWSDILLGLVALLCAYGLRHTRKAFVGVFVVLALATWLGAFYHGLIDTTEDPVGNILWKSTLLSFAISSGFLLYASLGRRALPGIVLVTGLYSIWALLGSEKFVWALLLQALAVVAFGWSLHGRSESGRRAIRYFWIFVVVDVAAIIVQQGKLQFGLEISHNTIFHIIEMPALVALYLSMRSLGGKKVSRKR